MVQKQQNNNDSPSENAVARPRLMEVVNRAVGQSGDPRSLVQLARAAAAQSLGGLNTASDDAQSMLIFRANADYEAAVSLARLQTKSNIAFRMLAWEVHETGEFLNVRLPMFTPMGEVLTDRNDEPITRGFHNFDDWFDDVAESAKLDPTIASVTRNCVKRLLPAVKSGEVRKTTITIEDGSDESIVSERVISVDDVMSIDRSKLEVMMSAINRLLDKYTRERARIYLEQIAEIIESAQKLTKEELKAMLSKSGLRGNKITQLKTYRASLPDGRTARLFVTNESEDKYLDGVLSGRLNEQAVDVAEMPSIIRDLVSPQQASGEENLSDYLQDLQ